MINDDEELPIVAYAVLVGTMFVTADDAQKVAELCNGVVKG